MKKLLAILGPTASGKTRLAVDLALQFNGEIISGDSMLVYRGFNIGTAKPDYSERHGVKHHLIDICEPNENYSAALFQLQAQKLIDEISSRGRLPILCGGTGLYAKALIENYFFSENSDNSQRYKLNELYNKYGIEALRAEILRRDGAASRLLDMNNPRRIIRAIEIFDVTGRLPELVSATTPVYNLLALAIDMPRQMLYERIDQRVEAMIHSGLIDEVRNLLASGANSASQSMQGIGYKEIAAHLTGKLTLNEAIERIKINTRHFAKRQLTWYKKMPYIKWLSYSTVFNLNIDELKNKYSFFCEA